MKCHYAKGEKCFGLGAEKECIVLSNTEFRGSCPFYKLTKTDYTVNYLFEGLPGVWRKIRGYDGRYFVSSEGEVINKHKALINKRHNNRGAYVSLYDGDATTRYYIATLVADAFVPSPGEGRICFKDGNILNCKASNIYRSRSAYYGKQD